MSVFKFNYTENTEMERSNGAPLIAGPASFKIIGCYSTNKEGAPLLDRDGDPKLNVSLSVTDSIGNQGIVYETLSKNTGWKISNILSALGLEMLYDKSGLLNPEDIVGGIGRCTLKMQAGTNGYADRMVIDKYLKADKQAVISRGSAPIEEPDNDPLPF